MTTRLKALLLESIQDNFVKQSFEFLRDFIQDDSILRGQFRHFEKTFDKNETLVIPHNLGFVPKDVIQTYLSGTGAIVYNYTAFTKDNISITISGGPTAASPLIVRFYLGRHE